MSDTPPVRHNEGKSRFEIEADGEIAYAEYRLADDRIIFPHTIVPEAFEGRGFGSALAKAGLSWAREQGLPVVPRCSFIAGYIERHPEYRDLVHTEHRGG